LKPHALYLTIGSKDADNDFYDTFSILEIEDNSNSACTFKIKLPYNRNKKGDWVFNSEKDFKLFAKINVSIKFSTDKKEVLIEGYITNINAHLADNETDSYIEIIGMDSTILLDLEEKEVTWIDKSDSDIANEIFKQNNFSSKVDNTINPPKEDGNTVIQRGTDIDFLKMLARRNGFECYVEKAPTSSPMGYFRKPDVDDKNKNKLYILFEQKSNLSHLDISVDGLRPMSAEIKQKNALTTKVVKSNKKSSDISKLGKSDLSKLYKSTMSGKPLTKVLLSRYGTDDAQEMEELVQSIVNEGSWFVVAKGTVNSAKFEHVLDTKKIVTIYGAGDTFSGDYYLTKVTHKFTPGSYIQEFEAKRNSLGFSGGL